MTDIKRVRMSDGNVVDVGAAKERIREGAPEGDHDAVADVAELRGRRGAEQLHAKLIPDASDALAATIERRGISRTDATNRLIQIGAFIDEKLKEGYDVLLRKDGQQDKEVHIV
jgi:hypothetical protein